MSDGTIAGTIAAGVIVAIGILMRMRGAWSSTNRQVQYDESATQWHKDQAKELEEMRKERSRMWDMRIADREQIARLESENLFLQQKVGHLESRIARLEGKTNETD